MLSVSRVTVWRLTKDRVLKPVEILPGTWRYAYAEIARLAHAGINGPTAEANKKLVSPMGVSAAVARLP